MNHRATAILLCVSCGIGAAVSPARAQLDVARDYDLPAQDLAATIVAIARMSGQNVLASGDMLRGRRAPAIKGHLGVEQALARALEGSNLHIERAPEGLFIRDDRSDAATRPAADTAEARPGTDIVVTGSRIRGAPIASTVITIGREQIRDAGQRSLGEVVRDIPQSFGGGQNPGIGTNVPARNGVDIGGGSSINLRGIGSDATLTLLDGHRLSYSASRQSVDVSAIPLIAVDRVEIVPEGSSALYGSDAVAGVANIILRKKVTGVETSATLGQAIDGGDFEQIYDALGGVDWRSGGLVAAYEYGDATTIESRDRSYAAARSPGLTLYPAIRHHSATINAHQGLMSGVSFEIDGLYNHRTTSSVFPLNAAGDLNVSRGHSHSAAESFGVTPTLRVDLPGNWRGALTGSYGRDRIDYAVDVFLGGVQRPGGAGYYKNSARSGELNGEGGLFALPAGEVKLAIGAGYRSIGFTSFKGSTSYQNLSHGQDQAFAYGELSIPIVSPAQQVSLVNRLNVSAALRYENYRSTGKVATPKLGLIYEPSPDLALKTSWGRSFRAPTLLERYDPASVSLVRATSAGGAGYPAGATVLLVQGGNPTLAPEKAESWSATLDLHPRKVAGATLELSYFDTRYRDRIVTPIGSVAVALSNPIYQNLIARNPSDAAKAAAIANAGSFVNGAGTAYLPGNVVAIIENSNVNAGRQHLHGLDVLAGYRSRLGAGEDQLNVMLDFAYLDSDQQLSQGQPTVPLAGMIFNPPQLRGRGSATWRTGLVALTGVLNYTGPVNDERFSPVARLGPMATADATIRVGTGRRAGLLSRLDLTLSVINAFNAEPVNIRTTLFTDTPYDSTNYSPIGRFVSVGLAKKW